jgi:hypothetical protein
MKAEKVVEKFDGIYLVAHLIACIIDCEMHVASRAEHVLVTGIDSFVLQEVCFPGITTHCGCIFHSPVAGFSLLDFEVS